MGKSALNAKLFLAGGTIIAVFIFYQYHFENIRTYSPAEVPTAFWAWRNQSPDLDDVKRAFAAANGTTLFLRAGQIDLQEGSIQRIRPVIGDLPREVEIHFVYNATRRFLNGWDQIDPNLIAASIADTYRLDATVAKNAKIVPMGIQLDMDVPTRLLPKYAQVLKNLRAMLPRETKISITGLASWTTSRFIESVLSNVDFWIPQCYGTSIPTNLDQKVAISNSAEVERTVKAARRLNKPFYAGLSAYGYAILYSKQGEILEIRGDIDPALIGKDPRFEIVESDAPNGKNQAVSPQYFYRANTDLVLDGLIIEPGEILLVELPSTASLRSHARLVRQFAGEMLLGICIFRLPTNEDSTSLTIGEVASALSDTDVAVATEIKLKNSPDNHLILQVANRGTARTVLSKDAFTIDLDIPSGSLNRVGDLVGFDSFETLCKSNENDAPGPCGSPRANVIRLRASTWKPGSVALTTLELKNALKTSVQAFATSHVDDGRVIAETIEVQIQ